MLVGLQQPFHLHLFYQTYGIFISFGNNLEVSKVQLRLKRLLEQRLQLLLLVLQLLQVLLNKLLRAQQVHAHAAQ